MDEAAIQQQQEIYKVQGVDEDAPALNPAKKRKEAQLDDVSVEETPATTSIPVPLTHDRRRIDPRAPRPAPRAMPEPLPKRMPPLRPSHLARTLLYS